MTDTKPVISSTGLTPFPLCDYFLSEYLANRRDPINFPPAELPRVLEQYEQVFSSALDALGLSKESLKRRSEFDFGDATPANLESGIARCQLCDFSNFQRSRCLTLRVLISNASETAASSAVK
jgi:hypothetical protein